MRFKFRHFLTYVSFLFLFSSCSQLQFLPNYFRITYRLNEKISTNHFIFHFSSNDTVYSGKQEKYIEWLTNELQLKPKKKIHYYKYKNREQISRLIHYSGNATVRLGRIHTIWPWDNHETVHVLMGIYVGDPPKLFAEGIAVAFQTDPSEQQYIPIWGDTPIDEISYNLILNSKIPPLDSLLIMQTYFKYSTDITYPVSGSFVKYLLEKYGINTFYGFVKICDWRSSSDEILNSFGKVHQKSLVACWNEWQKYIVSKFELNQ